MKCDIMERTTRQKNFDTEFLANSEDTKQHNFKQIFFFPDVRMTA